VQSYCKFSTRQNILEIF